MAIEQLDRDKLTENIESFHKLKIVTLEPNQWHMLKGMKLRSLSIERIAFEDFEEGTSRYEQREDREWMEILEGKMIDGSEGERIHLFATEGVILIGMISARITQNDFGEKRGKIQHVYVEPDRRKHGVGTALMEAQLRELKVREVRVAELSVVTQQKDAINMYKKFGFCEVKLIPGGARRGEEYYDKIEMELRLG